jgi:IclR family transcriptional regulator, pca regulon regulatory protein
VTTGRRPNGREQNGEFVEALARGLDVITCFGPTAMELTVSDVASRTGLARPTARRLLMTLEQLGYVRSVEGTFSLTTEVLRLGTSVIAAQGVWEIARPHLLTLVGKTAESSSMSQLDGSDIVYTARVPVPKIIAFAVSIGTLFPAVATSMGKVLLSDLESDALDATLEIPSRSGIIPRVTPTPAQLEADLAEVRERGWALSDELLSVGIRSVAAPVRNHHGRTVAAMNVTVHAAETSISQLTGEYLPYLLSTAAAVTDEWSNLARLPIAEPTDDAAS